jgi:outer membrane protein assembly factor BamA
MLKKIIIFSIPGLICLSSISFAQSFYDYELKLIKFSGNNYFSQSDLETIIESKETPMWFWSFLNSFTPFGDEPVFFDSSKISIDKLALEEYYRSNGYFRISVKDSIVADSTDKTVELYYQITENKPFNYGKISFFGLNKLSEFDYSKIMLNSEALDSSKQYSESDVQNKISSINRNLVNNGYELVLQYWRQVFNQSNNSKQIW